MTLLEIMEKNKFRENLLLLLTSEKIKEELSIEGKEQLVEDIIKITITLSTKQDNYFDINFEELFHEIYLEILEVEEEYTFDVDFTTFLKEKINEKIELYIFNSRTQTVISFVRKNPNLNYLITRLLNKVNLTEQELFVLILYYGLEPIDKEFVSCNGISVTLDGKPRSLVVISKLLGVTLERCRKVNLTAIQKLFSSEDLITLGLIEYAENPDLALRLKDISNNINTIPFTDKYPNIYSFFKEYTEEEIEIVFKTLDKYSLLLIANLKEYNEKVTDYGYNLLEKRAFYQVISTIYNKLIQKYGRRPMITELSKSIEKPYGIWLNKLRDFYNLFFDFEKDRVVYMLSTLSDYQRETLVKIFGFDLNRVLTPGEILKIDDELIKRYDSLVNSLKNELTLNKKFEYRLPISNESRISNGLSGIYQVLGIDRINITIDMVNDQLSVLFTDELAILKKVFGPELIDSNYFNRLKKLSNIELKTYYNIIFKLIKKINKVKNDNDVRKRRKKKIEAFCAILLCKGYLQEEIDSIIETPSGFELLEEYIKWGTSKERREEIIKQIKKMIEEKYDVDVLVRLIMSGSLPKKELKPKRKAN